MMRRRSAVTAALLSLLACTVSAASFDCTKARSTSEKLICEDRSLSRADEELARLFRQARDQATDKARFKADADAAWRDRETRCQDRACVAEWIQQRTNIYSENSRRLAAAGSAPTARSGSASDPNACTVDHDTLYCDSASSLVIMYPLWLQSNSLLIRGYAQDPQGFYRAGCGFAPSKMGVTLLEERRFALKDGAAQLRRVRFGKELRHPLDRYSREGEYLGKTMVGMQEGWLLKRDLACGGDVNAEQR